MSNSPIVLNEASIRHGAVIAVDHLSATFVPGTITALVGGDGAGKTSLLAALANPFQRARLGVTGVDDEQVGYQSAHGGVWNNLSVAENLEFISRAYRLAPEVARKDKERLLDLSGLTKYVDRIGGHLSGGMRQKLGCVMAMLPAPRLLLLDEPTTGVDPISRQTLWELMRTAAGEETTVIVSTTYLDEAALADQVIVLSAGKVLAQGSPAEIIENAPGVITAEPIRGEEEISSQPHMWQRANTLYTWRREAECRALGRPQLDLELATIALLLDQGTAKPGKLPDITSQYPSGRTLVQARDISMLFGEFPALDHVNLSVESGKIIGLVGGNGAGKSTLIRLILGLDQPSSGEISLFGQKPGRQARSSIGYVPQSLGLYPTLSPEANYQFINHIFHHKAQGLGLDTKTSTGKLPLGQQRNLAVTCALSHQPRLLILDEPTSGMDALSRANLWKTLHHAANHGIGVLITTHYRDEAKQCDQIIHLEHGKIVDSLG